MAKEDATLLSLLKNKGGNKMAKRIESKKGLETLANRMCKWGFEHQGKPEYKFEEFNYWWNVVAGCILEDLAMDEVDYENAPIWFRPLWKGLK